jgi:hypothetical protein
MAQHRRGDWRIEGHWLLEIRMSDFKVFLLIFCCVFGLAHVDEKIQMIR